LTYASFLFTPTTPTHNTHIHTLSHAVSLSHAVRSLSHAVRYLATQPKTYPLHQLCIRSLSHAVRCLATAGDIPFSPLLTRGAAASMTLDTSRFFDAYEPPAISIWRRRLPRRPTPTGPVGAGGDPRIPVHYGTSTRPAGGVCEVCFAVLSPTNQRTVCGPEDIPLLCSTTAGLRRRSDGPTRTTPSIG
jgi:hypothetical protein